MPPPASSELCVSVCRAIVCSPRCVFGRYLVCFARSSATEAATSQLSSVLHFRLLSELSRRLLSGYPVVCSDPNRSQSCGREAGILFVFILWRDNGLKTGARLRHRLGGAPASQSSSMSTLRMHRVESWSAPRGQGWPHWAAARV